MADLLVKDVPADLERKLRRCARSDGRTLRDFVLDVLQRKVARRDFQSRLEKRTPVALGRPAARALDEVRAERERDLDK